MCASGWDGKFEVLSGSHLFLIVCFGDVVCSISGFSALLTVKVCVEFCELIVK